MSTTQELHYLFDMRGATVANLTPIDAKYPKRQGAGTFDSDATGGFVLSVPAGLDFSPSQVHDGDGFQEWQWLVQEKHAAILARYPGFGNIVFDDMTDASGFDASTASGVILGGRGSFSFGDYTSNSTIDSLTVSLGSTPSQAVLWAESFFYIPSVGASASQSADYSNSKAGRFKRVIRPWDFQTTSFLRFDLSFDNGGSFLNDVTPDTLTTIPMGNQGSDFILRVRRRNLASPSGRIGLGGWALIY